MAAFDSAYPDAGWVVASSDDATGDVERVATNGRVKAGGLLDFAFTCERDARISVHATNANSAANESIFAFEGPCSPGQIGRATGSAGGEAMFINLDVTVDPAVRHWVMLGVSPDDLIH